MIEQIVDNCSCEQKKVKTQRNNSQKNVEDSRMKKSRIDIK